MKCRSEGESLNNQVMPPGNQFSSEIPLDIQQNWPNSSSSGAPQGSECQSGTANEQFRRQIGALETFSALYEPVAVGGGRERI
jgi:hypothetical protein